jgi:hypothetical protein
MATRNIYYVKLGPVKFAWRATDAQYPSDFLSALGVSKAKDTDDALVFGADSPRPPRVRINLKGSKPAIIRFCSPDKLESLTVKGSLNAKKYKGTDVDSVVVVSG